MKAYHLLFTRQAKKDIAQLPETIKQKVANVLEKIVIDPFLGKPLKGELKGQRSFRLSDYRIIYQVNKKEILVIVLKIGHRRKVYRN